MKVLSLFVAVVAAAAVLDARLVAGKRVRRTVSSSDGFAFLGKFCFDFTSESSQTPGGRVKLSMTADKDQSQDIELLFFDDQDDSWPAIYQKDIPCQTKRTKAINFKDGMVPASYRAQWFQGKWELDQGRRVPINQHRRPRFWYMVASNCRGFKDLGVDIHFTNLGGSWKTEFGVNVQGLNTLYLLFFFVYAFVSSFHLYGVKQFWDKEGYLHPIVKLLTIVMVLQTVGVFCHLVNLAVYTEDGEGVGLFSAGGDLCVNLARVVFVLLLILLANGWCISTEEIPNRKLIFGGLGAFVGCYALLWLWSLGRDPASTLYVYDSVPGFFMILIDLAAGVWFHFTIFKTWNDEQDEEKSNFYRTLWMTYGAWFLTLPVIVTISHFLHPWVREKTVTTVSMIITTCAYSTLCYFLYPTRATNYFKISKIAGVSEDYAGL